MKKGKKSGCFALEQTHTHNYLVVDPTCLVSLNAREVLNLSMKAVTPWKVEIEESTHGGENRDATGKADKIYLKCDCKAIGDTLESTIKVIDEHIRN